MGLFKVFFYFPNGKSTIWGIYSEYIIYIIIYTYIFLFFGNPLSKSNISYDLRYIIHVKAAEASIESRTSRVHRWFPIHVSQRKYCLYKKVPQDGSQLAYTYNQCWIHGGNCDHLTIYLTDDSIPREVKVESRSWPIDFRIFLDIWLVVWNMNFVFP